MGFILQHFKKPRVLLTVIHRAGLSNALDSVQASIDGGADGVLFINQGASGVLSPELTVTIAKEARARHPDLFLGLNILGHGWTASKIMELSTREGLSLDGLWLDRYQDFNRSTRNNIGWRGLTFGGVAFKYQPEVPENELEVQVRRALYCSHIPTTSGPKTGTPASIEKLARIKSLLPADADLGVASGVSVDNVEPMLPYVSAFIVASSLEDSFGCISLDRVVALARKIHG